MLHLPSRYVRNFGDDMSEAEMLLILKKLNIFKIDWSYFDGSVLKNNQTLQLKMTQEFGIEWKNVILQSCVRKINAKPKNENVSQWSRL